MFSKLSDKKLEERLETLSEQMISSNAKIAQTAAILYRVARIEQKERAAKQILKKNPNYKSPFKIGFSYEGRRVYDY